MQTGVWISLTIYFAVMLGIGFYAYRTSTGNSEQYILGGRNLPPAVAALSAGLLLAALILLLAGPFLSRRPRKPGLRAELRAARALTPPARRLRLLHLLAERNQALPADLSAALYAPTPPVDLDARLEALLRAGGAG